MIDLLLQSGDLTADKYGDIALCADEDNDIIQTINNNILLRLNGNKFHKHLGNNIYNRRIKANQNGLETVKIECIDAIMNSDVRVKEVRQIDASITENANCLINYTVAYIKGDELIEVNGRAHVDAFNMKGGE